MKTPLPLVSCLMATHGRYREVCRTVVDFLQQDYPHKELLILNNHPAPLMLPEGIGPQNMTGRAQVRIFNESGYPTLGDCRRRLLELAEGEYVRTWDDDDCYHYHYHYHYNHYHDYNDQHINNNHDHGKSLFSIQYSVCQ